jgi:hypothetical protein
MEKENLLLAKIRPTQPQIMKSQLKRIGKILVPVACILYKEDYYVLDGHARCIRARQEGLESIQAIALSPEVQVDFGIVKTAREMKLQSLDDVAICNGLR